jgi:hypothetical protein
MLYRFSQLNDQTVYLGKDMKRLLLFCCLITVTITGICQEDTWKWWNEIHHWKSGMPGWRTMMFLSPGYLGPNALPVPEMKKGLISGTAELETTVSAHFLKGDPTQDFSAGFFYPVANGKLAFEAFGVALEKYGYSGEIRNLRISRDKDGKGIAVGDFYFSVLIQLCKDRKFPNTMLRFACKTASGDAFAARYTDTPGYYFDVSSSRDIPVSATSKVRPFASFGFYSWQTYNEATPQNDAIMYGAGVDYLLKQWMFSGNFSGYSGYLKLNDKPQVFTMETKYDWKTYAVRCRFLYGIRDWKYKTIRLSFIWKLG